jgi:hypothetical protein
MLNHDRGRVSAFYRTDFDRAVCDRWPVGGAGKGPGSRQGSRKATGVMETGKEYYEKL